MPVPTGIFQSPHYVSAVGYHVTLQPYIQALYTLIFQIGSAFAATVRYTSIIESEHRITYNYAKVLFMDYRNSFIQL